MWGPQEEAESIATLHAAVDAGINFFDSAEGYGAGRSEQLIGKAFKGMRDKVIIATKVSQRNLRPRDVRAACEKSLKTLAMDHIDVYYLHWPNWNIPFEETMGEMGHLRDEGKIRFVGCSNFGKRDLTDMLEVGRVEANQLAYNLLFRAVEHEIVPACIENQVGIACYSPLLHGVLAGKYARLADVPDNRARTRHFSNRTQTRHGGPGVEAETQVAFDKVRRICDEAGLPMAQVALAWLLEQPAVATVIAGASRTSQVLSNAKAAELDLSDDIVAALNAATEPLKVEFGTNADMWENDQNSRMR